MTTEAKICQGPHTGGQGPRGLDELVARVAACGARPRIALAACAEAHALGALLDAMERGIAQPLLVGDMDQTTRIAAELSRDISGIAAVHAPDPRDAVQCAVDMVRRGEAEVLMKGLVNTDVLLRRVLNRATGLPPKGVLSHVAVFELPAPGGTTRLAMMTDAAVNIRPNLQRKLEIVHNAVAVARALGIARPRVAMLAATEKVILPAMPATLDAQIVARMADQGEFGEADVAGPMALDIAISPDAAARKGVDHPVAGRADILVAPDIESGNILYKSLTTLAHADMASTMAGSSAPLVVTSRGDSERSKFCSIALAGYLALSARS